MRRFLVLVMTSILAVWPIASCGGGELAPFFLEVIPGQMEDSVSGQRCVFLVTVEDDDAGRLSTSQLKPIVNGGEKTPQ